ncbi:Uncharacterized protein FKW44_017422 [Caligus rogercresseyi]|uniref:Uncharacterized protein n=1 Tax=Caligus rogercresseyi TaxID=217165 RepID=A0A7T8GT39_CALRO|nr:Uncharacterized protein FKW44_017422 [Caligus rogercresseyi]
MKVKRLERCTKIRSTFHKKKSTVTIFSDKDIFTVDQVYSQRNDWYLAESVDEVKESTEPNTQLM